MKKGKWLVVALAALVILGLAMVVFSGNVWNVETNFSAAGEQEKKDVEACGDLVKRYFFWNFQGAKLLSLSYDAQFNEEFAPYEAERMGRTEAIILHSDWVHRGKSGPVEPGYVYTEWKWIFVKTADGLWELTNYGYG